MSIIVRDPREAPIVFAQPGDFAAADAAERALARAGFSIGQTQVHAPRAILLGRYDWIAKWRNLTHHEKMVVDGEWHGGRNGPIRIVPSAKASPEALEAFEQVRQIAREVAHA